MRLPGERTVELGGLPASCRVNGPHPRTILLPERRTISTMFVLTCE